MFFRKKIQQNFTILVVDTDIKTIDYIGSAASAEGHSILLARNGRQGRQLAAKHKPSIVVFDLNLPDIRGIEFCRLLKNDPETKDIPLVVYTALNTPTSILEFYEQGVEDYIVKPLDKKFLMKELVRIIQS